MNSSGWNRRDFMGAAALVALAVGLPSAAVVLGGVPGDDAPSARQRQVMAEVAERVIPATDTLGGAATGTGDFVLLALAHGLDGTRAPVAGAAVTADLPSHLRTDGSLDHAAWLEQALDTAAGGDWLAQPVEQRHALLAALDAEAYAEGNDAHPWRAVKKLVLTGYYTSEAGGSQELAYAAVPGRWDPAVPVTPGMRAYSNEWTGVDFG